MSTTVQIRLPVPEGRPGDIVSVSDHRADALVRNGYAIVVVEAPDVAVAADAAEEYEPEAPAEEPTEPGPVVDMPAWDARKSEWAEAAEALGYDTDELTKAEIVELVKAALGSPT